DRVVLREAEHAWFRVARLRTRRGGADLDEAETERGERVDVGAVLVESRREADRVVELQAERLDRQRCRCLRDQRHKPAAMRRLDRSERDIVRALGIQAEQERAGEGVQRIQWAPPSAAISPTIPNRKVRTSSPKPTCSQPSTRPATAMPSPSSEPGGTRRISERAIWPHTIATIAPITGKTVQASTPNTRLTTAEVLDWRAGTFMQSTILAWVSSGPLGPSRTPDGAFADQARKCSIWRRV